MSLCWATIGAALEIRDCKFSHRNGILVNFFCFSLSYHHTGSATLFYGLREGLAIAVEEGLKSLHDRHNECSQKFQQGIAAMGLEMFVPNPANRLPTVNAVKVPVGVDPMKISKYASDNHLVEIAGGLGPTAGQIIRIGFMGENAKLKNVDLVLQILGNAIEATSDFKLKSKF